MSPHPGDHGAGLATSGNALRVAGLRRGAPQNIPTRLWLLLSFEKELFKLPVPHAEKKSTPWHPLFVLPFPLPLEHPQGLSPRLPAPLGAFFTVSGRLCVRTYQLFLLY